jgi:hypothetical protein
VSDDRPDVDSLVIRVYVHVPDILDESMIVDRLDILRVLYRVHKPQVSVPRIVVHHSFVDALPRFRQIGLEAVI